MMTENELTLRIDTKYNRISIHRKTIAAIGDPTFIHFGYESESKSLMILGTWVDDTRAVRVSFDSSGSFYIHSKRLIEGIRQVGNVLMQPGSFLMFGEKVKNVPAVSFSLKNADKLSGESTL
jgi:hypothetical protein